VLKLLQADAVGLLVLLALLVHADSFAFECCS
jgi:hypothetical protein